MISGPFFITISQSVEGDTNISQACFALLNQPISAKCLDDFLEHDEKKNVSYWMDLWPISYLQFQCAHPPHLSSSSTSQTSCYSVP